MFWLLAKTANNKRWIKLSKEWYKILGQAALIERVFAFFIQHEFIAEVTTNEKMAKLLTEEDKLHFNPDVTDINWWEWI